MQQIVVPSKAEVLGQAVMSVVGGMEIVQSRALKILAENGISPLKADNWYQLQSVLSSFRTIFEKIGPSTVRAIGRKIPEHAQFPEADSLEKGLHAIDSAYKMAHRSPSDIGGYKYESGGGRSARMLCDNPYPCELDQGLIEAICERYRPQDALWIRIEHDPKMCRHRGDRSCVYNITW